MPFSKKHTPDDLYLSLRRRALTSLPHAETSYRIFTVCVDYHFKDSIFTLVSRADGTAELYRSKGGNSPAHSTDDPLVAPAVHTLHIAAEKQLSLFKKEKKEDFPLPAKKRLTVRLVTPNGVYRLSRKLNGKCRSDAENELFDAINRLLSALTSFQENYFGNRDASQQKQRNKVFVSYLSPALWTPIATFYRVHAAMVDTWQPTPFWDTLYRLIKPSRREYHSYRKTILHLPPPETALSAEDTVVYSAIVEQRCRGELRMTVLRLSGTVDFLQEGRRGTLGADRNRPNVIRSVRAFLRSAVACLPLFTKEEAEAHPFPSRKETAVRFLTNRGVFCYMYPNGHPEWCCAELLKPVNLYFNLLDTLQE